MSGHEPQIKISIPVAASRLLCLGMEQYGVSELTVNEQNPAAAGFYRHMGFAVYRRSELDEQGGPYPILYMRRG